MKKIILSLALYFAFTTAANAYLIVSPGSMEFGGVKIGTQSSQIFFIDNVGTGDERIFGCNVFGAFQCSLNCFGTLPRGQSCSGMVYFRPQSERYEFETVMIQSDRSSAMMSVHGVGTL